MAVDRVSDTAACINFGPSPDADQQRGTLGKIRFSILAWPPVTCCRARSSVVRENSSRGLGRCTIVTCPIITLGNSHLSVDGQVCSGYAFDFYPGVLGKIALQPHLAPYRGMKWL